jgi:ribosomal-protein-alanine N-acetyltransferase
VLAKEKKQKVCVHIRWIIKRDMPEIFAIETTSFEFPWQDYEFNECLRQKNNIGLVAEYNDRVVGFMVYELQETKIHILNLAVRLDMRGLSVGSQMIAKLTNKLSTLRRNQIILEIRETNLSAQLFLQKCGFKAISVLHKYYIDTPEDAYLMQYEYGAESLYEMKKPKNLLFRIINRFAD